MIKLKIQAYLCKNCCKQEYNKEGLSWYNFNAKGIIFSHDNKQIVLLTSMRINNPKLQCSRKNKIDRCGI